MAAGSNPAGGVGKAKGWLSSRQPSLWLVAPGEKRRTVMLSPPVGISIGIGRRAYSAAHPEAAGETSGGVIIGTEMSLATMGAV
jgi:hypothetical protein